MKSFRDLRVWQKAMDLVERVYLITQGFPREETQLEIATRLKFLQTGHLRELLADITSLGKQLYALRNALLRSRTISADT